MINRTTLEFEHIPGLMWCQERLCYRGIVPRNTSFEEVEKILNGLATSLSSMNTSYVAGVNKMQIIYSDEKIVHEISFSIVPSTIVVADIVAYFGTPCATSLLGDDLVVIFPSATILANTLKKGAIPVLSIYSPVQEINLLNRNEICQRFRGDVKHHWNGFTSYSE